MSSLPAWRKLGSLATHYADSEDSDQTGGMPRLVWVFAGRTLTLLVLSWGGSIMFKPTLLFHKTTAVYSFRTPKTFLHTWLIRPPFTIVPRGGSLQVLRFCDLVLFYPCSVQHCNPLAMESFAGCLLVCPCLWFHVLSKLLLLLRRLPCTLLMLTSPFNSTRIVSLYMYM